MASAWVLPRRNKSALCQLTEGAYRDGPRLVEVATVPMPPLAAHVLHATAELLVYGHGRTIGVIRLPGASAVEEVRLPLGHRIHAVELRDEVVYVGSSGRKAILGLIDLRGDKRWTPIDVPPEMRTIGKGVDGIALFGNRLVAVDDIVLPRLLLVYDISAPRAPRFVEGRGFPWVSTNEKVVCVASDGPWMAVLSHSMNHGYAASQIALVSLETLQWHAALRVERPRSVRRGEGRRLALSAVALASTRLFLAAGADGIGFVDVDRWLDAEKNPRPSSTKREAAEIPIEEVRFQGIAGGDVCGVIAASTQMAFAIVRRGLLPRIVDTEVVRLP